MNLAIEHRATEEYIRSSGLKSVMLRNGWYTENYTAGIAAAVQHGAVLGAARNGRISAAARIDYAEAAARGVGARCREPGRQGLRACG